jgi:lipopolysaccharide transport system permease protein
MHSQKISKVLPKVVTPEKASSHLQAQTAEEPEILIRPAHGWAAIDFRELWDYRELLYFLIWRDLKVRYKQTVLGVAWAVLQPLMTMVVFSIFFGWLAGMPSDGVPYPIFAYTALVPWTYFANALTQASHSVVEHEHMLRKIYFPRLLIPVASVCAGLVNFAISFSILVLLMLFYGLVPTASIWAVPLLILMAAATALGVGLWAAALHVKYRDVRYVIPFLVQFWLFATPIAYPSSLVPEAWRPLYGLNPMAGVVEGFRWALLSPGSHRLASNTGAPNGLLAVSALTVLLVLIGGLYYFRRMEDSFADVV